MVALSAGTKAPAFNLKDSSGQEYDLLPTAVKNQAVLVAFFKVGCPVCQFTFPYLERLHRSYPDFTIWGVSQDDADATDAFVRMYGVSFPILLDKNLASTVDYDLESVPSIFLVDNNQTIVRSFAGFSKGDLESLGDFMAQATKQANEPVFTVADEVPAFRPG